MKRRFLVEPQVKGCESILERKGLNVIEKKREIIGKTGGFKAGHPGFAPDLLPPPLRRRGA